MQQNLEEGFIFTQINIVKSGAFLNLPGFLSEWFMDLVEQIMFRGLIFLSVGI